MSCIDEYWNKINKQAVGLNDCVAVCDVLHSDRVSRTIAAARPFVGRVCRGKSGLHRAGCQVTPGGREPTASAAENIPPNRVSDWVRVKWCGKSAPRDW